MVSILLAKNIHGLFGPTENLKKTMQISDGKQSALRQKFKTSDTFSQNCFTLINQCLLIKACFVPKFQIRKGLSICHTPFIYKTLHALQQKTAL